MPPTPLLILWIAWIVQSLISVLQVRKFARLFDRKQRGRHASYRPPVSVIVPFKGVDSCLDEHVRGLFQQDYPEYELLFVVDSESDPAYPLLVELLSLYPQRSAQVLVAGPAQPNEGQKIHNQLFAIDYLTKQLNPMPSESPVWVFADSDAVPGSRWLADLIEPLSQCEKTGLTTGYRWLIPVAGANHCTASIWSHLASVMNSSVACAYGRDAFNHAWGGSMAVRADTAIKGKLRDRLSGALCDDYQFSRMSRDLGLRVYFTPWCLVATPVDFDLSGLINFVHRQYLLTRVYAPKLFGLAFATTSLYVAGWVSVWVWLLLTMVAPGSNASTLAWPAGIIAMSFIINQVRASFRRQAVERSLETDAKVRLRVALSLDRWATPVWMVLHWMLIVRSCWGRTMRWRGMSYRLFAPQQVENLQH